MADAVMAHQVMAHIVMAYIAMAYTAMAYVAMAYILMAYILMAYTVMALYSYGHTCDPDVQLVAVAGLVSPALTYKRETTQDSRLMTATGLDGCVCVPISR